MKAGSIQTSPVFLRAADSPADPHVSGPSGSGRSPEVSSTEAEVSVESVPEASHPSPQNWAWMAQSVSKLSTLCNREAELTSHSRETLNWGALAGRLSGLGRKLAEQPPARELARLRMPPLAGEEEAHEAATALVKETMNLVSEVSTTAAAGGHKTPQSILKLCGKIALGVIATLGAVTAALLIPVAGPYLATLAGLLGTTAIATLVLAHREHGQHAQELADLDRFLAQLGHELPEPEPSGD